MKSEPKLLHQGEFLKLYRNRHWEYAQRVKSSGSAVMLAITDAREIVLVEQFRIPMQLRTIELPAGIIGDSDAFANETVEDSAMRELLEETGYQASKAKIIMRGPTAAGMTSEMANVIYLSGLSKVHAGGGVDGEDITVHVVPLTGVHDWLLAKQAEGLLIEPKIYAGLYFVVAGKL